MASFPHPHRWGLTRRSTAYLLLFAMVGMLFPLHFHAKPSGIEKDDSTPFPCQNRPCGCRTAQQCWKKCCCFSNSQKVAWAKANNVKVPEFVRAAARLEEADFLRREICSSSSSANATLAVKSAASSSETACKHCSKTSVAASEPAGCQKTDESTSSVSVTSTSARNSSRGGSAKSLNRVSSNPSKSKWVLAIYATACQGQGPPSFCFPTSIVPEPITLVISPAAAIDSLSVESERLQQTSLRPPLPPPKIV